MTTSRADLLAGVDMVGGESFCDSIYNFLKNQGKDINLFTNSGFGVWSQSDTNKGLATMVFDSGSVEPVVGETLTDPTSGATAKVAWIDIDSDTWGGGTATGTIYLGAVTGTFEDNSDITGSVGGANMLTVNGDATIGVKNDPCNNNSTAIWTKDAGLNLAFGAALYTVDTDAVNLRAWITAGATLVAGKIYKIELDINDGVVNTKGIQGYFDDGAAQYGRTKTTGAGFVSVSWTFECATSTVTGKVGFRIVEDLGGAGQNIQIRRFSCYEITPCCTAGDNLAFDGWEKDVGPDLYREHNGVNTKDGSFYALAIVPTTAGHDAMVFPRAISALEEWYMQFQGRPVTFGMWVLAYAVDHARLRIQDSVDSTYSDYHTGGGDYEWLEVTKVIDAGATSVEFKLTTTLAGDIDGTTLVYVSQDMAVFGWSLGEGMYQPRLGEIIWLRTRVNSNLFDFSGRSSGGYFAVNTEADSDARLPKGLKALQARSRIRDVGSFGFNAHINIRADATQAVGLSVTCGGIVNDYYTISLGWLGLDPNGDYEYELNASGALTLDVDIDYLAVQVN